MPSDFYKPASDAIAAKARVFAEMIADPTGRALYIHLQSCAKCKAWDSRYQLLPVDEWVRRPGLLCDEARAILTNDRAKEV